MQADPSPEPGSPRGSAGVHSSAGDPFHGLARHGAWHMAALFVPGLYAVLLVAYLFRSLGPEGYGIWAAATALVGYLTLLDAGLSATTARAAARTVAGDRTAVDQVRTAYAAYLVLGLAAALLGGLLSGIIPIILGLTGVMARDAWLVGAFLALDLGIVIATAGWMGTLRGTRRYRSMLVVNVVQVVVAVALLVLLLPAFGLAGAAAAQPVARTFARAVAALILSRSIAWFAVRPRWPGRSALRTISAFSLPILAIQAASQLGTSVDVLIVGAAAGPTTAGLYAAGAQLPRYLAFFLFPTLGVMLPAFSDAFVRRPSVVPILVRRAVRLAGLIGGVVFGGLALHAAPLLETWSGQSSALSVQVLVLYALAWIVMTPTHVMVLTVIASGRHGLLGMVILAEAMVNAVLSIILVAAIGPVGAAVSSLLIIAADDILILPALAARSLGSGAIPILANSLGGAMAGVTIALAVGLLPVSGVEGLLLRGMAGLAALIVAIGLLVPGSRALVAGRSNGP